MFALREIENKILGRFFSAPGISNFDVEQTKEQFLKHLSLPFQIWFFTDDDDLRVAKRVQSGHLINTKCSSSHNRSSLCCKMAAEIMAFANTPDKR